MKKIIMFYMNGCPYCANAKKAMQELKAENQDFACLEVEMINENEHPEISAKYDYYYVPTFIVDGQKVYEAHPGEKFAECKEKVRGVFEAAL